MYVPANQTEVNGGRKSRMTGKKIYSEWPTLTWEVVGVAKFLCWASHRNILYVHPTDHPRCYVLRVPSICRPFKPGLRDSPFTCLAVGLQTTKHTSANHVFFLYSISVWNTRFLFPYGHEAGTRCIGTQNLSRAANFLVGKSVIAQMPSPGLERTQYRFIDRTLSTLINDTHKNTFRASDVLSGN